VTEQPANARALIEHIAQSARRCSRLKFSSTSTKTATKTVIELEVAEADLGKVIGRSGRVARAFARRAERGRIETGQALRAGDHRIAVPEPSGEGEFITLAWVVKTQGRRGEVAVELHTDIPEPLSRKHAVCGRSRKTASSREVQVEDLWLTKACWF